MHTHRSFSFQLQKSFLISTFFPFILVASFIAAIYSFMYHRDIQILLDSTAHSMVSNIRTYMNELNQLTLQPYYTQKGYYYLKARSMGNQNPNGFDELDAQRQLDENMTYLRLNRQDVDGIYIVTDHDCIYYTVSAPDHKSIVSPFQYSAENWYQKAIAADGKAVTIGPHSPDYIHPSDAKVVSVARAILSLYPRFPLCVMKIDVNTSMFQRIFLDFALHVDSTILIRDENGLIVYSNTPLGTDQQMLLSTASDGETISMNGASYQIHSYPVDGYPWNICIALSGRELDRRIQTIYMTTLFLYLLGIAAATLSHATTSRKMVHAIDAMRHVFDGIQKQDFGRRYSYISNTELDDLGDQLNYTVEKLEQTIRQEYILTIKQKESEFKALQSQIQPHFLFNTLNNMIALNQIGDQRTLEDSLYGLSGMLRYILKAPSIIPLAQEIQFVKDYCALQKLRFNDRLNCTFDIAIYQNDWNIPKLLLQPIVENSIRHGIEPCTHPCLIEIKIKELDEEALLITISDNGIGFDIGQLKEGGIGIRNVKERLSSYSPESTMEIQSSIGNGTCTMIKLKKVTEAVNS
ncbi:hypothetical protein DW974_17720 [Lachnospiraceae bacterium AM48-27BH]|nr:hypothetical protein DW974_17720 [Lachnospiraceae bacterium AM48-27BH]